MKKINILAAWGHVDCSCAAAITLRKFPDAEVSGMSQRRLPIHLTELSEKKKCPYNKIIILGIGMNKAPDMLITAIDKLRKENVEIIWISAYNIPYKLKKHLTDYADHNTKNGYVSITEVTANYFDLPYNDLEKMAISKKENMSGKDLEQFLLIKSAQHRYRSFQDKKAFEEAIKTISTKSAKATTAVNQQKMMIEFYKKYGNREIKGESEIIKNLHHKIKILGPKENARILITGESGTGKETIAVHLHEESPRKNKPLITFNCASTNKNLLESHLFGHIKGAFTGAISNKKGVFEEADGGTLFLDEIAELPLEIQANILRVLQEGRFNPLGSTKEIQIDVRIIAATNKNLPLLIRNGEFREDLYYRLNVVPIHIAPLREHIEDVDQIANNFWYELTNGWLESEQIEILKSYDWPGNVRELKNFLDRAYFLENYDFNKLLNQHRKETAIPDDSINTLPENMDELIRYQAKKLYIKYGENKVKTAKAMGMTRVTLRKYLN